MGLLTIALTGASGGRLLNLADVLIAVPSNETPRIQECHILLGHALCDAVEQAVAMALLCVPSRRSVSSRQHHRSYSSHYFGTTSGTVQSSAATNLQRERNNKHAIRTFASDFGFVYRAKAFLDTALAL